MDAAGLVVAGAAALPLLAVPVSASWGRWGLLPLLAPRRARCWYRHTWLAGPRSKQKSAKIGAALRAKVMCADRRRCVNCKARRQLQVDHLVPWALGGRGCLWNCFVLCKPCNMIKSNYWRSEAGRVYYRPFWRGASQRKAAWIVWKMRARRWLPWRWLRAYGLLPSW